MVSVFKQSLYRNPGIEIRRSDKNGWGIFARRNIKKHSLLEEVPIIVVDSEKLVDVEECLKYSYGFSDTQNMIGLGFAGLYNHSFEPNADWRKDHINMTMEHFSIRDIVAGEEILINYGEENIVFDVK